MLILFDIDGTLLVTRGAGKRAFLDACRAVLDRSVDATRVRFAGNTDPRLFRAFCEQVGVEFTAELHESFAETYRSNLERELAGSEDVRVLPGVHAILDALASQPRVTLGLLTGNYARTAPLKLRAVDIDPDRFHVQVFGDEGERREDLPPVALARHAARAGVAPAEAWIVGDTVADVACARASGLPCLAVATGLDSLETLERAGAHRVVLDLARTDDVLRILGLEPS